MSLSKKFVVQQHKAKLEHWDLRLQTNGEMRSWAIPKGPSMNPAVKRLVIETTPHSLKYANFEGVIDEGLYGAGKVMQWDKGVFKKIKGNTEDGFFEFELKGQKLKGAFVMVKSKKGWVLVKKRDEFATKKNIVKTEPKSVKSGKTINKITKEDGFITKEKDLGFG